MNTLRKIAKKIPILSSIYRKLRNRYEFLQLRSQPPEAVLQISTIVIGGEEQNQFQD